MNEINNYDDYDESLVSRKIHRHYEKVYELACDYGQLDIMTWMLKNHYDLLQA